MFMAFITGILFWQFACTVVSICNSMSVKKYVMFTYGIFRPMIHIFVVLVAMARKKRV